MLDIRILDALLECNFEEEIFNLLKDEVFPDSDNSKFSDDILRFKTSTSEYMNLYPRLDGITNLAFKTILLLKLHGHIGVSPKNSGIRAYANTLSQIIRELFTDVKEELNEITPIKFIESLRIVSERIKAKTAQDYIVKINDWITFANPLLPYILRIDERLTNQNDLLIRIKEKAFTEHREYINGVGGIKSKLFPLQDTKNLMKKAIDYIENYSEEILSIVPIFLNRKENYNDYQERKHIVEHFKKVDYIFKEPKLKKFQEDCFNLLSHKVQKPAIKLLSSIRHLEGACIFIALTLTGYRASEFVKIERFPIFKEEEHPFLSRIVTKTSINGKPENIEMPIPSIARKAIEIISKLTALRDGKKKGDLLLNSWENKNVNNVIVASQRLSLAIKFFCKEYNISSPTPHMARHTMAFLIVYFSEGDSLELAKLFLGHKSITMTLRYLGHFNRIYQEAISEFEFDEAKYHAKQIANEIRYGNRTYGKTGERIIQAQFSGIYVEEFADLLETGLIEMVKLSQYVILSTPYCYCIHDKSTTNIMPCQKGINYTTFENPVDFIPLTGRCKPSSCDNALFTEADILRIQSNQLADSIPEEFKKRISKNIYFINDCGLDELDTSFQKIIKQYNQDQISNTGA
ncbi:site-specific integrase [Aliarcobacter butzleri]|nr:site-specific integrase [Aliarcobacter butzleri]